jgi:hypothetical protein
MRSLFLIASIGCLPMAAAAQSASASHEHQAMPVELQQIARQVHTGKLPCELNQTVTLLPDAHALGHFNLFVKNQIFHMKPVASATGAVRLEDEKAGAVWIQLANKSMLMSSKIGQRLADECQSPAQVAVAKAMKLSPPASLLEPSPQGLAQK